MTTIFVRYDESGHRILGGIQDGEQFGDDGMPRELYNLGRHLLRAALAANVELRDMGDRFEQNGAQIVVERSARTRAPGGGAKPQGPHGQKVEGRMLYLYPTEWEELTLGTEGVTSAVRRLLQAARS